MAPQVPEGEKGKRAPGGGGGAEGADILRSRFQTTAFFLGSVVTDANGRRDGHGEAARQPHHVPGDGGRGDGGRPLRQGRVVAAGHAPAAGAAGAAALPARGRPVRRRRRGQRARWRRAEGRRVGRAPRAPTLRGPNQQQRDARAGPRARGALRLRRRSGRQRFRSASTSRPPATRTPWRSGCRSVRNHHPRSFTVAGVLHDTATAEVLLPDDIDPARSSVTLSLGSSPLAMIRGARAMAPGLSLLVHRADHQRGRAADRALPRRAGPRRRLRDASAGRGATSRASWRRWSRRQRADGGIGLWSADRLDDALAQLVRRRGAARGEGGRHRGERLASSRDRASISAVARRERARSIAPVADWYRRARCGCSDRVAAVDYLSRARAARSRRSENELLRAGRPARLGGSGAARGRARAWRRRSAARARLLEPAWAAVKVEGRPGHAPRVRRRGTSTSPRAMRPAAWLLQRHARGRSRASAGRAAGRDLDPAGPRRAVDLEHAGLRHRRSRRSPNFRSASRRSAANGVRVSAGRAPAASARLARRGARLERRARGLLVPERRRPLDAPRLALRRPAPARSFYYLTVTEVPRAAPVRPGDRGIRVERWYESYEAGRPVTEVAEGELVRVRLRITVPERRALRGARRRAARRARGGGPEPSHASADSPGPARPDSSAPTEERTTTSSEDARWVVRQLGRRAGGRRSTTARSATTAWSIRATGALEGDATARPTSRARRRPARSFARRRTRRRCTTRRCTAGATAASFTVTERHERQ